MCTSNQLGQGSITFPGLESESKQKIKLCIECCCGVSLFLRDFLRDDHIWKRWIAAISRDAVFSQQRVALYERGRG